MNQGIFPLTYALTRGQEALDKVNPGVMYGSFPARECLESSLDAMATNIIVVNHGTILIPRWNDGILPVPPAVVDEKRLFMGANFGVLTVNSAHLDYINYAMGEELKLSAALRKTVLKDFYESLCGLGLALLKGDIVNGFELMNLS